MAALVLPPEQGQLVSVRQRQYVVSEVAKSSLPSGSLQVGAAQAQYLIAFP